MPRRESRLLTLVSLLLLVPALAACSEDTPAVCDDVQALQTSMDDLRSTDVSQEGLDAVSDQLATMRDQVDTLVADASDEYASEADVVKQQVSRLGDDLRAAQADPSAATLATVGEDVRAVGRSLQDLATAVDATC